MGMYTAFRGKVIIKEPQGKLMVCNGMEDHLKGSNLKRNLIAEHMKNTKIVMKQEESKEYDNLFKALNINIRKI